MSILINPDNLKMKEHLESDCFFDKSMMISTLNRQLGTNMSFFCITRPEGFGKTFDLDMLSAYYSIGCDSRELFKGPEIEKDPSFEEHLNRHHVIRFNMKEELEKFIKRENPIRAFELSLIENLEKEYGIDAHFDRVSNLIYHICRRNHIFFVVLIDDWDAVFLDERCTQEIETSYYCLLYCLFKSLGICSCFNLVYMTGLYPIPKTTSQSGLNNFLEVTMLDSYWFTEYSGFKKEEVQSLCKKYHVDETEMESWYGGYRYEKTELFHCSSVLDRIHGNPFGNHLYDEKNLKYIKEFIKDDIDGIQESLQQLLNGENVRINTRSFDNTPKILKGKDETLTALVHLGYLTYDDDTKKCHIPNLEAMESLKRLMNQSNI